MSAALLSAGCSTFPTFFADLILWIVNMYMPQNEYSCNAAMCMMNSSKWEMPSWNSIPCGYLCIMIHFLIFHFHSWNFIGRRRWQIWRFGVGRNECSCNWNVFNEWQPIKWLFSFSRWPLFCSYSLHVATRRACQFSSGNYHLNDLLIIESIWIVRAIYI